MNSDRAFAEYDPVKETHAVMLTLVPKFEASPARKTEFVFVVDR
jgi:hypothetical protein